MITRSVRLVAATAVFVGLTGAFAAPAFADPQYVCVLTGSDRSGGICLETDRIPPPSTPQ